MSDIPVDDEWVRQRLADDGGELCDECLDGAIGDDGVCDECGYRPEPVFPSRPSGTAP